MVRMYQLGHSALDEVNAVKATEEFSAFLKGYIDQRRSEPQDDLITQLIEAQEEGKKLSEEELIGNVVLLLNAGHEATVNVIGNGVYALLKHPQQLQLLREQPELIEGAVEELLRYDTPLHFFKRWVLEDTAVGEQSFAFKNQVAVLLGAANHDPAVFDKPEATGYYTQKEPACILWRRDPFLRRERRWQGWNCRLPSRSCWNGCRI